MPRQRLLTTETWPFYIGGLLGPFGTLLVVGIYPELRDSFSVGSDAVTWSFSGYLLPMAVLMLVSGTIGERYGRHRVTRIVFVVYAIAAVLSALAPTIGLFVISRVVQGAANAFISPLLLAGLIDVTPPDMTGRAVGIYTSFQAMGGTAAPLVAGSFATFGWRWAFVLVAVVAGLLSLRPPPGEPRPGALAPPIRPLLRLRMAALWAGAFFAAAGPLGIAVIAGVYLRDVLNTGSVTAGVILGLGGATTAVMSPFGGDLLDRLGPRRLVVVALAATGTTIALIGQTTPLVIVLVLLIMTSAANACVQVVMQHLAAEAVPTNRAGGVSSVFSFRFAGHAIGPLVLVPLIDDRAETAFLLAGLASLVVAAGLVTAARRVSHDEAG